MAPQMDLVMIDCFHIKLLSQLLLLSSSFPFFLLLLTQFVIVGFVSKFCCFSVLPDVVVAVLSWWRLWCGITRAGSRG